MHWKYKMSTTCVTPCQNSINLVLSKIEPQHLSYDSRSDFSQMLKMLKVMKTPFLWPIKIANICNIYCSCGIDCCSIASVAVLEPCKNKFNYWGPGTIVSKNYSSLFESYGHLMTQWLIIAISNFTLNFNPGLIFNLTLA